MSTTVLFASFSNLNLESELNLDNLHNNQQLQPGLIDCETLVVFDNRVENLEILYAALLPNSWGYTLTPQDDALVAITDLLAQTKAKRLAIAAHGTAGVLQIGKSPINRAEIHSQARLLQQWNVTEIALYSCEVGKDAQFISELAWLTKAQIFASTGKVGAPTQGGRWELDIQSGVGKIDLLQKCFLQEVVKGKRLKGKGKIQNLSPFPLPLFPTAARSLMNMPFIAQGLINYPGLLAAPTAINLNAINDTHLLQASGQRGGETDGQTYRNYFAFAALKSDGSVVTWGNSFYGGDSSNVTTQLASGVTNIFSTSTAFAALKSDGSVVTWGFDYDGGDSSSVATQLASGVTNIFSTNNAFAALKADGSVVTWGSNGGDSTKVKTQLASGVTNIFSTTNAFAALKADGSVVTWGSNGGNSSSVSTQLGSGVTNIFSTANAFAALKSDGSVVTWGYSSYGGDSSSVATQIASGVTNIFSTANAFAALKSDGSVVTWGSSSYGGNSSTVATQLTSGVTNIFSTANSFAALKSDGSVVTWGTNDGGDSSKVKTQLASGVTNIFATASAFAALKSDGSVVTWGGNGGDSSNVTTQLASGVINIFATGYAFAALKSDGSVITWGDYSYGGNSSKVKTQLASGVVNIFSTFGAFAALKSDGSVITWGDYSYGGDSSKVSTQLASGVADISSPFESVGLIVAENNLNNSAIATLSSVDPNTGDTFTYSLVSGTGSTDNNLFTIQGNQLLFNAPPNFEAKSSYSIRIRTTDQTNSSYEKAFTINVTAANDTTSVQPVISANLTDTSTDITGTIAGANPDGTVYGITDGSVDATNNTVTKEGNYGTLTLNTQTGEYTYTPNANAINALASNAADDFTFTVNDGSHQTTQAFQVNISAANDAPTLQALTPANLINTSANDTFASIIGTLVGADTDSTNLVYNITDGSVDATNNIVTKEGNYGTLTLNTQTGEYTYTPNANAINGLTTDAWDDFTFTVSDGNLSASQAFTINITTNTTTDNDTTSVQPVISANLTDTSTDITGTIAGANPDGTVYGITDGSVDATNNIITKEGNYGTLTLNTQTGEYTYTPNANAINGLTSDAADDFTFTVNDGSHQTTQAFEVNIPATNDTASVQPVISANLTDTNTDITGILTSANPDSTVYGITDGSVDATNNTVTKEGNYGTLTLNTQTGEYTYTPNANAINGLTSDAADDFTFTVNDGSHQTIQAFEVNIPATNDTTSVQPVISANLTDTNTDITGTIAGANPDGTVYGITDGSVDATNNTVTKEGNYGTLTLNTQTGEYTYTPNANAINGLTSDTADDFTFTVNDGSHQTTQAFQVKIPLPKVTIKDQNNPSINEVLSLTANPTQQVTQLINSSNDIFQIRSSQTTTKLQVSLKGQNSQLVNELAVFTVDDDNGTINGTSPGTAGYVEAAIARSSVIFSAIAKISNGFDSHNLTRTLQFTTNDKFRFALIKNNTFDAVKAGKASSADILFSNASNQKITDLGNHVFSLGWRDGSHQNVSEFNDLVVNVQATDDSLPLGTSLQNNSQGEMIDLREISGAVSAKFTVTREASYDSFVGFYQVTDANGGIDTNHDGVADVLVGQADYLQAAISQRVAGMSLTVNNQGTASYTSSFAGGGIFAPFIIVNGRPEDLLDKNPNNDPAVYFPLLGANSDKSDHIRLLGNNIFGFEDLAGLGDQDYNDMIVKVDLTQP